MFLIWEGNTVNLSTMATLLAEFTGHRGKVAIVGKLTAVAWWPLQGGGHSKGVNCI